MSKKIVNVKINGELVSSDTKIRGVHLCGNYCPLDVYFSCPKVKTCGNLSIMKYPFIIDGKQVIKEKERVSNKETGEKKKVMVVTDLVVTKCKRYEMAKDAQKIKNMNNIQKRKNS